MFLLCFLFLYIKVKTEGEHSNSLHNIFVFVNEVLNKCYTKTSVTTNSNSGDDTFCAQTSP